MLAKRRRDLKNPSNLPEKSSKSDPNVTGRDAKMPSCRLVALRKTANAETNDSPNPDMDAQNAPSITE